MSFVADCVDEGAGDVLARVLGETTLGDDVIMDGDGDAYNGTEFLLVATPADERELMDIFGDSTEVQNYIDGGSLMDQTGNYIAIDGETALNGVNYSSTDCTFAGSYTFILAE